jgi:hypothetical protein
VPDVDVVLSVWRGQQRGPILQTSDSANDHSAEAIVSLKTYRADRAPSPKEEPQRQSKVGAPLGSTVDAGRSPTRDA